MNPNDLAIHHNTTTPPPPPLAFNGGDGGSMHVHRRIITHLAFYWGKNVVILFSGWPGTSSGMYALALIFVFSLAVLAEFFTHWNFVKPGSNRVAKGFFRTGIYGVRVGLAYMVILAVMSYNGGVFLAAVIGHAVGFAVFSRDFNK